MDLLRWVSGVLSDRSLTDTQKTGVDEDRREFVVLQVEDRRGTGLPAYNKLLSYTVLLNLTTVDISSSSPALQILASSTPAKSLP